MDIFKPIERVCPWMIPPRRVAITLWPFIFYRSTEALEDIPLKAHEHFHWKQALKWGVVPWYLAYLLLLPFYFKQRPDNHPMERQAYDLQRRVAIVIASGISCGCGKIQCDCTERGYCFGTGCGCGRKV